jgi:hypothetical protein
MTERGPQNIVFFFKKTVFFFFEIYEIYQETGNWGARVLTILAVDIAAIWLTVFNFRFT